MEIFIQLLGYMGLILILWGVKVQNRVGRQLRLGIGAALLGISAFFPEPQWIFVACQAGTATVGLINIREGYETLKKIIIFAAAATGIYLGIVQSAQWPTYIGIVGLIGIAIGYSSLPEKDGGHQNLAFFIGGSCMVAYSAVGVYQGVWQALPFFILNIPFAVWGFEDWRKQRKTGKIKA
jgi:hypothetical protein